MKNLITLNEWDNLEKALAAAQIPYKVHFDNHNGIPRKVITVEEFSIFPYTEKEVAHED